MKRNQFPAVASLCWKKPQTEICQHPQANNHQKKENQHMQQVWILHKILDASPNISPLFEKLTCWLKLFQSTCQFRRQWWNSQQNNKRNLVKIWMQRIHVYIMSHYQIFFVSIRESGDGVWDNRNITRQYHLKINYFNLNT